MTTVKTGLQGSLRVLKSEAPWEIGLVHMTGESVEPQCPSGNFSKNYAVCADISTRLKHKGILKYRFLEQSLGSRKLSPRSDNFS